MNNKQKAKLLNKHFGVYGYGNFDVSTDEMALILDILDRGDAKALHELYELLETRMG